MKGGISCTRMVSSWRFGGGLIWPGLDWVCYFSVPMLGMSYVHDGMEIGGMVDEVVIRRSKSKRGRIEYRACWLLNTHTHFLAYPVTLRIVRGSMVLPFP